MKNIITLLVLTIGLNTYSQEKKTLEPKLENMAWIAGTWHGEAFGGITEEIWSEPYGGSMMATFKLIVDEKVKFYEIEVIREFEDSLILQLKHFDSDLKGWETKNETVDFPLKEITENKVVFEGMTFEKVSPDEMNVYVDINNKDDAVETVKFNYKKVKKTNKTIKQLIKVKHAQDHPKIDGIANEAIWKNTDWHQIDQLWLGEKPKPNDFYGRYKLTWTENALYLLAEIKDDKLLDLNENPLIGWWNDDCLEIFIDEDNSGGIHQYTHNAFAYHVALNGDVVDFSTEKKGTLYNSHIVSERKTTKDTTIWEVKISIFNDTYSDYGENTPVKLRANKNIGFALAYCDNDNSETRENFFGSIPIEGEDKNRGWIDADVFGTLILVH